MMRKFLSLILITAFFFVIAPFPAAAGDGGVLVVKLKESVDQSFLERYAQETELLFERTYRIGVSDIELVTDQLQASGAVEYIHPDETLRIQLNANDPLYVLDRQELGKQWYLPKIEAHKAWEVTTGSSNLTVAVVDTGINGRHEDLSSGQVIGGFLNYCQVPDPEGGNNCLVRVTGTLSPGVNSDDNGHGTIVAGIIGATANNQRGIAGINWQVKLMPVKVLNSEGSGSASDVAQGIRWAADQGADIINLSIGGPGLGGINILSDAVSYAFRRNVLVAAAAGNDAAITGGNLNQNPVSPVCMDNGENMVVGVAAVDSFDRKARFSNFGSDCIDISAPGTGTFVDRQTKQGLVSTYFDPNRPGEHDLYVFAVGTSLATPMVSGTAALMKARFPNLDVKALRDRLIAAVDDISSENITTCDGRDCGDDLGKGRLNAFKALSTSIEFSEGTVVQNSAGSKFLIESGLRRPISDFVFQQRFQGVSVTATSQAQLDKFPSGDPVPPTDGTLVKAVDAPVVYLVEGRQLRGLSLPAFVSRDFQFSQVASLPAVEVSSYPRGEDAAVRDGVLLKSIGHPAVYILENGKRRLLSFFVFTQRGFEKKQIAEVSEAELSEFPFNPQAALFPPVDGSLIRVDVSATVYLIENGRRRGLNLAAFQNRGFQFADVVVLPQSEVNQYEQSDTIIE